MAKFKARCKPRPPITPIAPMAASSTPSHRRASAMCGIAPASGRPTPAHVFFGRRSSHSHTRVFWPEAIAARWSCGPHVTPAQIVGDDAELGYLAPPTARHFGDVPPSVRPLLTLKTLC
jgi:hypothetical protein